MKIEQFINKLRNTYPVNVNQELLDNIKLFCKEQNLNEIDIDLLYHEILQNYKPFKHSAFPPIPDIIEFWKNIEKRSKSNKEFKNKYESAQEELDKLIERTKTWPVQKIIEKGKMCRNMPRKFVQTKHTEFLCFWDDLVHEAGIMDDMNYDEKRKLARLKFVKDCIVRNEYFVPLKFENKNVEKVDFGGQNVE